MGNVAYLFGVADPGWVKSQDPDMGSGMKLDPESGKQPGSATLRKPQGGRKSGRSGVG